MASEIPLGSLNRARYAGLDFDTHGDDLRARLQVKYAASFNDFAIASLGIMLLDLTAYGLDTLSFYLDRRATDQYLATARTRKSVARTCRQLGYKMGGAVASSVDVEVTVEEIFSFDVPIPAGFQFNGPDDLIFETAEEVTFTPAEQGLASSKFVPCYEGETIQESFVSDGTSAQVFELRRVPDDKFVVQGTVEVRVDGALWGESDLLEYGATDQYEVGYNDEPSTIRFGDGIAGNIPTTSATIDVVYVASRGKSGQVSAGTIDEETSPLIVAFAEIPLSINNPKASVGGDDRETLASAKAFAPKVWKSREVAVTGEDYEALSGSYADPLFGRVAVAKAISSRSAATDLTVQNYLTAIQDAVVALDTSMVASISAMSGYLDTVDAGVSGIASNLTDMLSQQSTITSETNSAITNARSVKDSTGEITVDSGDIGDHVVAGKSATDGSSATSGEKATIKGWFDLINAEASAISTAAANAEAAANSAIVNGNAVLTEAVALSTSVGEASTSNASIGTASAALRAEVDAIDAANDDLSSAVDDSESGINDHLDKLLSADCKSNLVTVPILVRDSGGFYTAPSTGLINSLQSYLDTKKEVTQTVAVTSGENFLIPAVIRVRAGVYSNYSEAVVGTAIEAAVEGVLRDRQFEVPLYESDIDDVVLEIEGVSFVNARIEGHLDSSGTTTLTIRLDSDGNLIILENEIITRGAITITTEAVEASS